MIDTILYEKVSLPREVEFLLNRPHIESLLKSALQKPLVTIIAGAGYGKTQAVYAHLESNKKNFVWIQLSELDNSLTRFWDRIIYGFRSYSQNLADNLKALGYPESIAVFQTFLQLFSESLIHKLPLIIVLDDFHLIHNKNILDFVEKLIIAQILNLSIVLISRIKPNLNLTGLLSKRLLAQINEDDLRLSRDELQKYYLHFGLNLDEALISEIYLQTEGWILAAYLIGLSLQKKNTHQLHGLSSAKLDIFDLIEKEIFAVASSKLQQLLLKFAVLDVIPKGLLIVLANYNETVLNEMTKINLLMRYDVFSDSYRIHHLFRDFLLQRKNQLTNKQILKIHAITAEWYEKIDLKAEAVQHYKKCNNYEKIFELMLTIGRRVRQDIADSCITLIDQAPENLIQKKPIMQIVKTLYLLNNNRIEEAHNFLTSLRKKYEILPKTIENQSLLGEIYIVLALISIINQSYEFTELFSMADSYLPNGSTLIDYRMNIADGINICGIKNPYENELEKYYHAMFKTMPYASKVMNGCCYGAEYLNAADSHLMTGNIQEAEKNAFEAIFHARQKNQHGIECMANFILIRIYVSKGNFVKATTTLKNMKQRLDDLKISDSIPLFDIMEGWFYVKTGKIEKIANWITYEEETKKLLPPVTIGKEYLVRSDSLLAQGKYNELLAYMKFTDTLYTQRGILYAVIQNKITKAIIYHYIGNHEASINYLTEAYELSNPNRLIIQYIEYGNQMRTVIGSARRNINCKIPKEWLNNIYLKSSVYAKNLSNIIHSYEANNFQNESAENILSKREKDVLICLSKGLTRSEIANSLYLSINTVKTTLQNIYSKLGASNKTDALRIATFKKII